MDNGQLDYFRGPCSCGKGEIVINLIGPENRQEVEKRITCNQCKNEFGFYEEYGNIFFARHADIEKIKELKNKMKKISQSIKSSPKIDVFINEIDKNLAGKSGAAIHRALDRVIMSVPCTPQTFRKHLRKEKTLKNYLKSRISFVDISKITEMLGKSELELLKEVEDLRLIIKRKETLLFQVGFRLCKIY